MFGQRQSFFSRSVLLIFLNFTSGCLETKDGMQQPQPETDFFNNTQQCDTQSGMEPVVEELPPQSQIPNLPESGIPLTPMDPLQEWMCSFASNPLRFTIEESTPAVFYIQPVREVTYCVRVERETGYLTLQHEEGEVHREENLFTWCVQRPWESEKGIPARLSVLSLTPQSEFSLTLQRGEE